jgi:hypothetical protein
VVFSTGMLPWLLPKEDAIACSIHHLHLSPVLLLARHLHHVPPDEPVWAPALTHVCGCVGVAQMVSWSMSTWQEGSRWVRRMEGCVCSGGREGREGREGGRE